MFVKNFFEYFREYLSFFLPQGLSEWLLNVANSTSSMILKNYFIKENLIISIPILLLIIYEI